ncbi:hypothetical protein NHF46_18295 [Arthrobacter alpinus]|nr:hypothetical protein [Arthrobacter alpinus]
MNHYGDAISGQVDIKLDAVDAKFNGRAKAAFVFSGKWADTPRWAKMRMMVHSSLWFSRRTAIVSLRSPWASSTKVRSAVSQCMAARWTAGKYDLNS